MSKILIIHFLIWILFMLCAPIPNFCYSWLVHIKFSLQKNWWSELFVSSGESIKPVNKDCYFIDPQLFAKFTRQNTKLDVKCSWKWTFSSFVEVVALNDSTYIMLKYECNLEISFIWCDYRSLTFKVRFWNLFEYMNLDSHVMKIMMLKLHVSFSWIEGKN